MVKEIKDKYQKEQITIHVLSDLKEWFGIPEATKNYIEYNQKLPFWAAFSDNKPIGFVSLKETSPHAAEIYCMGVLKKHHHLGYGKALLMAFQNYAIEKGYKLLQVKTVQQGKYDIYDQTNAFYRSFGFYELEVFPKLWDERNPCQVFVKPI